MRGSARRRITIALIGLLVLVLVGWFIQGALIEDTGDGSMPWHGETSVMQLRSD